MDLGYFIENNIITAKESDELIFSLSSINPSTKRAGARHLMSNPKVSSLAQDPRLIKLASFILGKPAIAFRATFFNKSIESNWLVSWHQDTALPLENIFESSEWGPWSKKMGINYAHAPTWALSRIVALRIHLDDSTRENGSLRVIPKSHLLGVLTDEQVFNYAKTTEFVECLVSKGGVLAMRPLIIHSSSKAKTNQPRRVLHIEYTDSLELKEGIKLRLA
ncbi:MAG: phytanoyl-CoA dioxygenase family protein [Acidobacteria bacterium]|nr:phytanoyl-CoA dioxygenase family protein [Acidobacteriota bacterium]